MDLPPTAKSLKNEIKISPPPPAFQFLSVARHDVLSYSYQQSPTEGTKYL
jgi:hypothetical protein